MTNGTMRFCREITIPLPNKLIHRRDCHEKASGRLRVQAPCNPGSLQRALSNISTDPRAAATRIEGAAHSSLHRLQPNMRSIRKLLPEVAWSEAPILIQGEASAKSAGQRTACTFAARRRPKLHLNSGLPWPKRETKLRPDRTAGLGGGAGEQRNAESSGARSESEVNLVMAREEEDTTIYRVVMNHEEQYSIWPADREDAPGWKDVGKNGTKAECLAYIKEAWTDMRPLSVRKRTESAATASLQPEGNAGGHR